MTLVWLPVQSKLIISDPVIIQSLEENKELFDKNANSFLMDNVWDTELKDNLFNASKSSDQV